MEDFDSSTSHPSVRATIDSQARTFFAQIAQNHVTALWKTIMVSGAFVLVGWASSYSLGVFTDNLAPLLGAHRPLHWLSRLQFSVISSPGLGNDLLVQSFSIVFFFIAATYFVSGLNNRRNRTRFFAAALWEIIVRERWRDRFQVERIVQGGKIGSILSKMKAQKGSKIDIQWTFFYREEHSSRLFEDCIRNNQKLRILLCKPDSDSLHTRVCDMKGNYKEKWTAAVAELSLGNLTFAREFVAAAEEFVEEKRGKDVALALVERCEIRFADLYIGRPQVIIIPDRNLLPETSGFIPKCARFFQRIRQKTQRFLVKIYRLVFGAPNSHFGISAIKNFLLSNNFDNELRNERVGIGIYLTQESSRYPFFIFRPEPRDSPSELVPQDAAKEFEQRWNNAEPLFIDGQTGTKRSTEAWKKWLAGARKTLDNTEKKLLEKVVEVPSKSPSAESGHDESQDDTAEAGDGATWDQTEYSAIWNKLQETPGTPFQSRWVPKQPVNLKQTIDKMRSDEAPEASTSNDASELGNNESDTVQDDKKGKPLAESARFQLSDKPLDSQIARMVIFVFSLLLSFVLTYWAQGAQPPGLPSTPTMVLLFQLVRITALLLQSISLAILFSIVDPRSLKTQFDGCIEDLRRFVAQQRDFGIINIVEGGKFHDIIDQMEVEHGDTVLIHWSFLQHEQASEAFAERAKRQNLDVALLLMDPFSKGLSRRMHDLSVNNATWGAMLAAKSLGNLDFFRRLEQYIVRFSALEMGRPMIIVCRRPRFPGREGKVNSHLLSRADFEVKRVALGHFFRGESSKYPFVIFGAQTGNQVCADALEFFINRWNCADKLDEHPWPPAATESHRPSKGH